ncbi:hypothetical protein K2Z83_24985 [Oscillochloris sp. ZM17-4]|uniref:hypothetical protein n=1 Tax=Oscillochloris sp. ZM17-4 TaxID=2866714 RepID=UPI001C73CC60|nr:hypothetical protein [Oscillochloris sp. ZM17-4]MBX0330917.1 hypothetical protein [Oscillochloris sp. ZM17-4]
MDMKCPFCQEFGERTTIHRHMVDAHMDHVTTTHDESSGKMAFVVTCPFCGLAYSRQVKPRGRNPRFLEEFRSEIALVAFDQILLHVLVRHAPEVGVDLDRES